MKFPLQDDSASFFKLPTVEQAEGLKEAVSLCVSFSRMAGREKRWHGYTPQFDAAQRNTSADHLDEILSSGNDVHGISSHSEISNAIVFEAPHIEGAVSDWRVRLARLQLDGKLDRLLRRELEISYSQVLQSSGHFWYPPGSFMSWHTNSRAPGWRCYLSFAQEPERSFFRLRDPDTGEMITSKDREFDIRLFRVEKERPCWHCVYSETERFSFGFRIVAGSRRRQASLSIRRFLGALLMPLAGKAVEEEQTSDSHPKIPSSER